MVLFQSFVLVVVGLAFEARIARTSRGTTICCRRGSEAARAMTRALDDPKCRGVISFGIAGGLDHKLPTGTHLVASHVVTPAGTVETDAGWSRRLLKSCEGARHVPILGTDHVVTDPREKRELFVSTGAVAVDTESHITAIMARERDLPFTCLRIVADPAHRRVPKAAMSGLREDGRAYPAGVVRALLRRPHETPALLAIARDTWKARRALASALLLAGDHAGFPPLFQMGSARSVQNEISPPNLGAAPNEGEQPCWP
jgi:hopanoid-associated phosphorylase